MQAEAGLVVGKEGRKEEETEERERRGEGYTKHSLLASLTLVCSWFSSLVQAWS